MKNGQIDFLKFLFAVVILVFHTKNFEIDKINPTIFNITELNEVVFLLMIISFQ